MSIRHKMLRVFRAYQTCAGLRDGPFGKASGAGEHFLRRLDSARDGAPLGVSLKSIEAAERFMAENPVDGFSLAGTVFDPAPAAPAPDVGAGCAPGGRGAPGGAAGAEVGPAAGQGAREAGRRVSCGEDRPDAEAVPCR